MMDLFLSIVSAIVGWCISFVQPIAAIPLIIADSPVYFAGTVVVVLIGGFLLPRDRDRDR